MFRIGAKVETCYGTGSVVGHERFYGERLFRTLVKLDDPTRWACSGEDGIAAFFEKEITKATSLCPQTGNVRDYKAEAEAYEKKSEEIRKAGDWHRQNEIDLTCARLQLESDEFLTAEEKAKKILEADHA